jgi:non-specific serine/threonine protein kinase
MVRGRPARRLLNPSLIKAVTPSQTFRAQLRPYQQAGLNWLSCLDSLGFGACLADDMGLAKPSSCWPF